MMSFCRQILPVLASFGPIFLAMGAFGNLRPKDGGPNPVAFFLALFGALMTGAALAIMARELASLRQLLETKSEGREHS